MAVQTSVSQFLQRAYPGQLEGSDHEKVAMINSLGSVRQVDTITVSSAAAAGYAFSIDVGYGPITVAATGLAGDTTTNVRDKLLLAALSERQFENKVSFQPSGAAALRLTASNPGFGFTTAEADSRLTLANTVANATGTPLPFGVGVVRGTGEQDALLPTAANNLFGGIVVRDLSAVDPVNPDDGTGVAKVPPGGAFAMCQRGRIYVPVEEAVTLSDSAFLRFQVGAAGTNIGYWRTDADATAGAGNDEASAVAVPSVTFESVTTGAGIALARINL